MEIFRFAFTLTNIQQFDRNEIAKANPGENVHPPYLFFFSSCFYNEFAYIKMAFGGSDVECFYLDSALLQQIVNNFSMAMLLSQI